MKSPDLAPAPARQQLEALVDRYGLRREYPTEVHQEVDRILLAPGIADPDLEDATATPFVTIDNEDSMDLDQALFIEREGDGYRVDYALADAAYYVRSGTALFAEAVLRGATYYLPGFAVPMLPRALSEGLVSLNPGVDRRALLMRMHLDAAGHVIRTTLGRARIQSRAKLSYDGVQSFYDGDATLAAEPFAASLELLRAVGRLRIDDASERDVVRFNRTYVEVGLSSDGGRLTTETKSRLEVEKYNEQISLLTNIEGAKMLRTAGDHVQPIFRVHEPPPASRVAGLVDTLDGIVSKRGLPNDPWRWRRAEGQSLASYIDSLPESGRHARLAKAIQRQAMVINQRSCFSIEAGRHYGIGADEYSRFSSPMREIVGIFTHKEALEHLHGADTASPNADDERLREAIVEAGNRSKSVQNRLSKDAYKLVLDQLFDEDLGQPKPDRAARKGTLMGRGRDRLYLELDTPPLDVKIYIADGQPPQPELQMGDPVTVRTAKEDDRGRFHFDLLRTDGQA